MTQPKIVLHIPPQTYAGDDLSAPHLALHQHIRRVITALGGTVEVRLSATPLRLLGGSADDLDPLIEAPHLHILENGTVQRDNVLNTSMAYLPGVFQLDRNGVLSSSSIGAAEYVPQRIDRAEGDAYLTRLRSRFVDTRQSRYDQPQEKTDLPDGAIAVFLQGHNPHRQGSSYCDTETLLRTVAAGADGRPVLVKAHPRSNVEREMALMYKLASEGVDLIPTDANVHDILAACAVTVSYNSAVAIEGFLHSKPAILFGRSDFHHLCETVQTPKRFPRALRRALASDHDYGRYLLWYMVEQNLPIQAPDVTERVLDRFAQMGFDATTLGLVEYDDPLKASNHAAQVLARFLSQQDGVQSVKILMALKVKLGAWVFVARINGEKVVVKRFFDADPGHTVRSLKGELDYISQALGDGVHQVNRCLMAWPDDGTVVLSFAQGPRLGDKIASARGKQRADLIRQSGHWLAAYTAPRRRETTFGPRFWIRALLARQIDHVTDPQDLRLLEQLIKALRGQIDHVMGCPVVQAATHGDFVSINAHYHRGVITGVDIQGECWLALAKETARFLVWLQTQTPAETTGHHYGIARVDWDAFVQSDVLNPQELTTTLPFFIGEQLYGRLIDPNVQGALRDGTRTAIAGYLDAISGGVS